MKQKPIASIRVVPDPIGETFSSFDKNKISASKKTVGYSSLDGRAIRESDSNVATTPDANFISQQQQNDFDEQKQDEDFDPPRQFFPSSSSSFSSRLSDSACYDEIETMDAIGNKVAHGKQLDPASYRPVFYDPQLIKEAKMIEKQKLIERGKEQTDCLIVKGKKYLKPRDLYRYIWLQLSKRSQQIRF